MPVWAICTAAGSGQRLGGGAPKALLPIGGQPMVVLAVRPFLALPDLQKLIVTAPPDSLEQFRAVLEPVDPRIVVVPGRADRQGSVRAGIEALGDIGPGILLVHDAARPFTPMAVICRVIDAVRAGASAVVPVVPVVDTLRTFVVDGGTEYADRLQDRAGMRAMQTPQGFDALAIKQAYAQVGDVSVLTDDASIAEDAGHRITFVPGDPLSFKITVPLDLLLARAVYAGEHADNS